MLARRLTECDYLPRYLSSRPPESHPDGSLREPPLEPSGWFWVLYVPSPLTSIPYGTSSSQVLSATVRPCQGMLNDPS